MSNITNADYINILNYYKIKIPRSNQLIQKKAENIMAEKLCRCIKKLDPVHEAKSIGICTKTIFNRKGFRREKFTCKDKRRVEFSKKTKRRY